MQRTPPQKRRKTSPTTSVPVDASISDSKLPDTQKDGAEIPTRRPSFASPTKASIARHNPQLLNRPSSSGFGSGKPGNMGKLDDLFANALGEKTTSESSSQREDGGQTPEAQRPVTPKVKGGLTAKPRRRSQSPAKVTEPHAPTNVEIVGKGLPNNPFATRSGLRRSPISSQAEPITAYTSQTADTPNSGGPFQKRTGLRRSPILSQPPVIDEPSPVQVEPPPAVTPIRKSALRRSPILPQPPIDVAEPINQIGTHPGMSPARKGALRRSPIIASSQPTVPLVQANSPVKNEPEERLTRQLELRMSPVLVPSQPMPPTSPSIPQHGPHPGISPARKGALRRSPVVALPNQSLIDSLLASDDEDTVAPKSSTHRSPILAIIEEGIDAETEPESPVAQNSTFEISPAQVGTPPIEKRSTSQATRDPEVSTTPKEPPPVLVTGALAVDDHQQEESEASLLKEADLRPATKISALRSSQRQQEPVVPLTFPRKALVYQSEPLLGSPIKNRPEPELPPTPTERGIPDPVVTTPPAGIHNTPSKRARRSKALGGILKSSPLKPRDPPPVESTPEHIPDSYPEASQASKVSSKGKSKETSTRRKSARFTVLPDPHVVKKAARDALFNQLQQLQTDVVLANQECERLRSQQEMTKKRAHAPPNTDELIALLQRNVMASSKSEAKPTSIFKSINSFLPFSSRRNTKAINIADLKKPLPSHRPIQLDDPLPHLKAFAPLDYKSIITLLPAQQTSPESGSQETEQPTLQSHLISLSHPSGLFSAQVNMIVNSSKLQIKEIKIPRLEPSAEKELGMFVRNEANGEVTVGKDISVMCWAMGRWTETAIKRAKFWHTVHNDFGTPETRASSLKKLRKKKRRRALDDEEDREERLRPTRRDLLAHMGRTNMEITSREVELLIEWKIGFDWTGEVENHISASARVPFSWHTADDRGSLLNIPDTFGRLVKEKGAMGAVRAVVGLLMGEG